MLTPKGSAKVVLLLTTVRGIAVHGSKEPFIVGNSGKYKERATALLRTVAWFIRRQCRTFRKDNVPRRAATVVVEV